MLNPTQKLNPNIGTPDIGQIPSRNGFGDLKYLFASIAGFISYFILYLFKKDTILYYCYDRCQALSGIEANIYIGSLFLLAISLVLLIIFAVLRIDRYLNKNILQTRYNLKYFIYAFLIFSIVTFSAQYIWRFYISDYLTKNSYAAFIMDIVFGVLVIALIMFLVLIVAALIAKLIKVNRKVS